MENIEKSPSLSAKLKAKNAVAKIKHGSPKLQEVLRERCRQRMKEKRSLLFYKRRGLKMETDEDVHETLTEIVRTELSQLATMDIDERKLLLIDDFYEELSEEEALTLENEILAEEEEWIFQEYERLQQDEGEITALFAEDCLKTAVFCPLCEKGSIRELQDTLICSSCDFRIPKKSNVEAFGKILHDRIKSHSSICCGQPSFMVLPEFDTICLYLTCDLCSTLTLII